MTFSKVVKREILIKTRRSLEIVEEKTRLPRRLQKKERGK